MVSKDVCVTPCTSIRPKVSLCFSPLASPFLRWQSTARDSPRRRGRRNLRTSLDLSSSTASVGSTISVTPSPLKEKTPVLPPPRRVHFQADAQGKIQTRVHTYDVPEDTNFDEVYIHKVDLQQIRSDAGKDMLAVKRNHPEYIDSIECLYESPFKSSVSRGFGLDRDKAAETLMEHSNERGLETLVSQLLRRHKKWAISGVISCQEHTKMEGPEEGETIESMLRARCELLNRPPVDFALLLGKADELEAQHIYSETLTRHLMGKASVCTATDGQR